ncbi:hypothetical protein B7463_g9273, partial [Scytalidium lignicola]
MSADELAKIHKTLFEVGIAERRNVVGDAYVDKALAGGSSEFAQPMQQLVTEFCWGSVWTRPGLERKQRSLINIGMLCALNRGPELGNHIRGAIRNGLTELEVREAILQVSVYCGMIRDPAEKTTGAKRLALDCTEAPTPQLTLGHVHPSNFPQITPDLPPAPIMILLHLRDMSVGVVSDASAGGSICSAMSGLIQKKSPLLVLYALKLSLAGEFQYYDLILALHSHLHSTSDLLARHNRLNHTTPESEVQVLSPSPSQSSATFIPDLQRQDRDVTTNLNRATVIAPQIYTENEPRRASYPIPDTGPSPQMDIQMDGQTPRQSQWQPTPLPNPPSETNPSMTSPAMLVGASISDPWFPPHMEATSGDFSSFLDSISLPSHQFSNYFQFEQPLPYFSPDPLPDTPIAGPEANQHQRSTVTTGTDPTDAHDSFTQFGSRLPSLQPEDHQGSNTAAQKKEAPTAAMTSLYRRPLKLTNVSIEDRASVVEKLESFRDVVPPGFTIVSRHALSRYITGFISGFHEHLPFLHLPTMSVATASLELVLALAAIGAQYCREPDKGLEVFNVAKAVCVERIRRRDEKASMTMNGAAESMMNGGGGGAEQDLQGVDTDAMMMIDGSYNPIETAQALLILMAMATWFERRPPAREAPAIRSLLETLMRDEGFKSSSPPDTISWPEWILHEGAKRTKFVIYCFFNLHSIVFDIPPMILTGKIDMELPCMEVEWKAPTEAIWREARRNRRLEPQFLSTFQGLFKGRDAGPVEERPRFSSLGSYILIHALIQHIWLTQELHRSQPRPEGDADAGHLLASSVTALEGALKSWQHSWERNPESSVDPLSPHGPLSFNSTALLRLAYIRINIDTGPVRSLGSCNPTQIAASIIAAPPVNRSKRMTRAALHCAHALSIPIKLGINSIAHTRLFWSIQHALCSLECALLLTKWLERVVPLVGLRYEDGGLSEAERRLLGFVVEMVAETEWAAPEEELLRDERRLSAVVVRVWARLFRSDDIWEIVDVIGRSLEVYADMLESR